MVDMWALYGIIRIPEPARRVLAILILSRKVQSEFICTEKVKRLLGVEEFSGHNGKR